MRKIILTLVLVLTVSMAYASGVNTFVKSKGGNLAATTTTWTPTINGKARIDAISVKFNSATNDNVMFVLNSELGTTYDTVLATSDSIMMNEMYWRPENTLIIERADDITITIGGGTARTPYTATIRGDLQ